MGSPQVSLPGSIGSHCHSVRHNVPASRAPIFGNFDALHGITSLQSGLRPWFAQSACPWNALRDPACPRQYPTSSVGQRPAPDWRNRRSRGAVDRLTEVQSSVVARARTVPSPRQPSGTTIWPSQKMV